MSTRSKVAIKKDFGLIIAVYNHFDSYIEGLGKTLVEKCNSKKLALQFVDKIADDNDYEFSLYGSEEEYCKSNENSDLNYIYLWRDDEWVYKKYPFTSEWYSVKDDLGANVNIQDISLDTESSDSCEDYKDVIERLENDLKVARKDREDLMNAVADGIQEFLKEHPSTSLQLLVDRMCKDEIERLEKRICELESDNSNLKAQIDRMRG